MPQGKKSWNFHLLNEGKDGITIMKNREERVSTRQGKLLGPIENISTPRSRTACTQAATYINQAVQVWYVRCK